MSSTLAVRRAVGAAIVLLYLLLAGLYALDTPPWQAPDEPAHFNYARHIAETGRLPELRDGDYPADYLEEIKTARFAPSYSIDGIRYESHQPPLYYLLASGVYRLGANLPLTQRLLLLRLFSVLLGGATIALIYATAIEVLPRRPWLAAAVGLVAATLPMHLTMTSAINSDALSELLIVAIGYRVLRRDQRDAWSLKGALLTGLLLGLAFLTKMQTYTAYGFVAVALLWDARKQDKPLAWLLRTGGTMLVVALLVAAPWLVRNMNVYGWRDPLAMARHAAVVQGQLTTSGYIEQFGRLALLKALPQTTFQSFWGQFGWMAVPMHPRIYQALALVCTLAVLGGASWLLRGGRRGLSPEARRTALILCTWLAVTTAGFLWWNLDFVQHQGRYLFPALLPLALGLVLGLEQAAIRRRLATGMLGVGAVVLLAWGLLRGDLPGFTLALLLIAAITLIVGRYLGSRRPALLLAAFAALSSAFSAYCLWAYVVPFLTP